MINLDGGLDCEIPKNFVKDTSACVYARVSVKDCPKSGRGVSDSR